MLGTISGLYLLPSEQQQGWRRSGRESSTMCPSSIGSTKMLSFSMRVEKVMMITFIILINLIKSSVSRV